MVFCLGVSARASARAEFFPPCPRTWSFFLFFRIFYAGLGVQQLLMEESRLELRLLGVQQSVMGDRSFNFWKLLQAADWL
ncbi:unnamed protein product [Meloidogyne enterolobii]|uniref:Uncharacterized protein n=1 Tax=Meloidogyne enterolobii TaxID=390850 RepID=A0ACB0YIR1_MELEN